MKRLKAWRERIRAILRLDRITAPRRDTPPPGDDNREEGDLKHIPGPPATKHIAGPDETKQTKRNQ